MWSRAPFQKLDPFRTVMGVSPTGPGAPKWSIHGFGPSSKNGAFVGCLDGRHLERLVASATRCKRSVVLLLCFHAVPSCVQSLALLCSLVGVLLGGSKGIQC